MATPYNSIYESFLQKVQDYSFVSFSQDELETELAGYLKNAIPKFRRCKVNLSSRDEVAKQFTFDLTAEEIEILANMMVVEYLKPKVVSTENLKQTLSDKDFKMYSQANHIKELLSLYKIMKSEVEKMIVDYTYLNNDFGDLK